MSRELCGSRQLIPTASAKRTHRIDYTRRRNEAQMQATHSHTNTYYGERRNFAFSFVLLPFLYSFLYCVWLSNYVREYQVSLGRWGADEKLLKTNRTMARSRGAPNPSDEHIQKKKIAPNGFFPHRLNGLCGEGLLSISYFYVLQRVYLFLLFIRFLYRRICNARKKSFSFNQLTLLFVGPARSYIPGRMYFVLRL